MAPLTRVSTDRPSRFTDGSYGMLYAGNAFEPALFETIHHHARFMARTAETPGGRRNSGRLSSRFMPVSMI